MKHLAKAFCASLMLVVANSTSAQIAPLVKQPHVDTRELTDKVAAALAECDVAVFPNRCEGATNLVAMEAMNWFLTTG